LLTAVIRVGFGPVTYTVNETEGVVTVCISVMDTLTEGTISVILITEAATASGMFMQDTCSIKSLHQLLASITLVSANS